MNTVDERLRELLTNGCPKCEQTETFKVFSRQTIYQYVDLTDDGQIDWGISEWAEWLDDEITLVRCPDCEWQEDL